MLVINWRLTDVFYNAFGLLILFSVDYKITDFVVKKSFKKELENEINQRINDC